MEFLEALIKVSEKAANIARLIRQEEHLFNLLVQQKDDSEANKRFSEDFKTLADVLIQEMVKHDLEAQFPEVKNRVRGEESNAFENKLGHKVNIVIRNHIEETADLLETVLNGDKKAATLLAQAVHKSISLDDIDTKKCTENFSLDIDRIGIWIDPIDSTAEYIHAVNKQQYDISVSGLNCVTVLIGAYELDNGKPVIGIINQPFANFNEGSYTWTGQCYWGICTDSTKISSVKAPNASARSNTACLSSTEDEEVKWKLKRRGYNFIEAAGAGYKILTVIKGQADCYVLSKNSTFKWDTCGPQAILRSLGGDIVNYTEAVQNNVVGLKYSRDDAGGYCNEGGLIAFRANDILQEFMEYSS